MRISHRYKFIFLANPRTASTSIRKLLDRYSDIKSVHISEINKKFPFYDHISALELKLIFEENDWDWESYRKFCVVRNPFDRVVSLYHHKLKNIKNWDPRMSIFFNLARKFKYMSMLNFNFDKYISILDPQKRLTTSLQNFICDKEGTPLVRDILKYESLNGELNEYLQKLGIDASNHILPVLNITDEREHYRKYYNEKTKERVEKLYKYEIERFGYKF